MNLGSNSSCLDKLKWSKINVKLINRSFEWRENSNNIHKTQAFLSAKKQKHFSQQTSLLHVDDSNFFTPNPNIFDKPSQRAQLWFLDISDRLCVSESSAVYRGLDKTAGWYRRYTTSRGSVECHMARSLDPLLSSPLEQVYEGLRQEVLAL